MGEAIASKVPQVTLAFWVIKLLATTVGETGGDALSMSLNLGYATASLIYLAFFAVTLGAQVSARRYQPAVYWSVVVATTTVGTTVSDYLDRTVGLGYVKSSLALLAGVIVVLVVWRAVRGRVQFEGITDRRDEIFYWLTIVVANTLGTALGDCAADDLGLGFSGGALVFAALLAVVAALHRWAPRLSRSGTLLGSLRADPPVRRHAGRHPDQTPRTRRAGSRAHRRLADHRRPDGGRHRADHPSYAAEQTAARPATRPYALTPHNPPRDRPATVAPPSAPLQPAAPWPHATPRPTPPRRPTPATPGTI